MVLLEFFSGRKEKTQTGSGFLLFPRSGQASHSAPVTREKRDSQGGFGYVGMIKSYQFPPPNSMEFPTLKLCNESWHLARPLNVQSGLPLSAS